jgi:hypothetical protein
MKTDNIKPSSGFTTVLITTLIPTVIASSIVAAAFNSFYSDFYKVPTICIKISSQGTSVNVTNIGRTAAKHFVLTVSSPYTIISQSIFATENITSIKKNTTQLAVNLPRFSNGEGSQIRVDLVVMNPNPTTSSSFYSFATYDEGSTSYSTSNPKDCPDVLTSFLLSSFSLPIFLAIGGLIAYFPLVFYLMRRQDRRFFVSEIIREVLEVRKALENNTQEKLIFFILRSFNISLRLRFILLAAFNWIIMSYVLKIFILERKGDDYYLWDLKTYYAKAGIIINVNDYVIIDDFYTNLKERNSYIDNNQGVLVKQNEDCLRLAKKVLEEIDWNKYKF